MIVRDSSSFNFSKPGINIEASQLRIGIVRTADYNKETDTFSYGIEAYSHGRRVYMRCRQLSRFGDAWNFEEWGVRPLGNEKPTPLSPSSSDFSSKPGEIVVVAAIDGMDLDGVILGSILHPSRKTQIKEKELAYWSSYNGLETKVDADGAYSIVFNGKPQNDPIPLIGEIPSPKYNTTIAGTTIAILNDGSVDISDKASTPQTIRIDKANTSTSITSGSVSIIIDGKGEGIKISTKTLEASATESVKMSTKDYGVEATSSIKISSPKIAIGTSGVELLDELTKLIDAIGTIVVNSPVGPCQPIKTSPMWAQIEAIKAKIGSIKGSL